jgi:phosphate acyltransferase
MAEETKQCHIALDAMGGDFAPTNEILGAISALTELGTSSGVHIHLYGDQEKISLLLKEHKAEHLPLSVVHCDEVVGMHDDPAMAIKKKKNSSLIRGMNDHKEGKVQAFVSAGNTGAVMSAGTLILGRIKGVSRPTIGTFLPSVSATPVLLVDAGANVDCKPKFLYEFAIMGSIYYREIIGQSNPKVGLLNVGEEESKGNEVVLETFALLKPATTINFIGNVEGRDILLHGADVIVCDGFTGNIVLKFAESVIKFLKMRFTAFAETGLFNKMLMGVVAPVLRKVLKDMDYQQYGGVPLLGVNGVVIIGHGSSSPLAIKNMILRADEMVRKNINRSIATALAQ